MWERTFSGDAVSADVCRETNGAYVAVGYTAIRSTLTNSAYFSLDWRLVEFNHRGDTLRSKRFGTDGDYDDALRLVPTPDQGLAVLTAYEARLAPVAQQVQRLVKLDSLWNVQWQVNLPVSTYVTDVRVLRGGDLLLGGTTTNAATGGPQAVVLRYAATGQPRPSFGPYNVPNSRAFIPGRLVHEPGDSLMLWGGAQEYNTPAQTTFVQRPYSLGIGGQGAVGAPVGAPFVPDYCRYPPQVNLGWQPRSATNPDSLVLVEFSTAGPRHAQNVRYRWELGDGTVRETDAGGRLRYRYAQVPPPGTPVVLTVTNNLGCTGRATVYPFGAPTAAQQGQALAARASLWPNPAADVATLALAGLPPGPVAVGVLDALGRVALRPPVPGTGPARTVTLDLRALPPGVYAVRVNTSGGSFSKRMVRY